MFGPNPAAQLRDGLPYRAGSSVPEPAGLAACRPLDCGLGCTAGAKTPSCIHLRTGSAAFRSATTGFIFIWQFNFHQFCFWYFQGFESSCLSLGLHFIPVFLATVGLAFVLPFDHLDYHTIFEFDITLGLLWVDFPLCHLAVCHLRL